MAWGLTLGGARSLSIDTPFYLPTNCDLEIDMAWNAISSNYEMIFGTWGTGFSDDQFYFGKYNAPNGTYTLYKRGGAVRTNSSASEMVVGTYAVLTLKRRGDNLSVLKDGVEICASITFSAGILDNALIKTFCAGNESGFNANVSVKSATLKNIDTATTTNLWDASTSDHSNTGIQPELLDTVGSNNATGVGFPTDGSAWIDLGGNLSSIILSSIIAKQITQASTTALTQAHNLSVTVARQVASALTTSLISSNNLDSVISVQANISVQRHLIQNHIVFSAISAQINQALINELTQQNGLLSSVVNQSNKASIAEIDQAQLLGLIISQQINSSLTGQLVQVQSLATVSAKQTNLAKALAIGKVHQLGVISAVQLNKSLALTIGQIHGLIPIIAEQSNRTLLLEIIEGLRLQCAIAQQSCNSLNNFIIQVHELETLIAKQYNSALPGYLVSSLIEDIDPQKSILISITPEHLLISKSPSTALH